MAQYKDGTYIVKDGELYYVKLDVTKMFGCEVQTVPLSDFIKKTNADRIRSMTDEELADLLTTDATCPCIASDNCNGHTSVVPINECRKHWEAWLRKEADNDSTSH